MLKSPLTSETIKNNDDEYQLVLDIFDTLKSFSTKYINDKNAITQSFDDWEIEAEAAHNREIIVMEEQYRDGMDTLQDNKKTELDSLAVALKKSLDNIEAARQRTESQRKGKLEEERVRYEGINEDLRNSRKIIDDNHGLYKEAHSLIIDVRPYKKLVAGMALPRKIDVDNYSSLMSKFGKFNPKYEANIITETRSFFSERLSGKYRERCKIFYDNWMKEQELYDAEMETLKKRKDENDAISRDAARVIQNEFEGRIKLLEEKEIEKREEFEKDETKKTESHDKLIAEFKTDKAKEKEKFVDNYTESEKEAEKKRDADLVSALDEYKNSILGTLPPDIVYDFAEIMNEEDKRVIKNIENFKPAQAEPLNVTVGGVFMKCATFEDYPEIIDFLSTNYGVLFSELRFRLPYSIALNETFSLFYKYSETQVRSATNHVQSICLKAFLFTPANKMKFYFIDPKRAAATFSRFVSYEDSEPGGIRIIENGISTDETAIEQDLKVIVDYITSTETNTFRGRYRNIREYNARNDLFPLPYTLLAIMDYPNGFTERAFGYLGQILATGKSCGVYCIVMNNVGEMEILRSDIQSRAVSIVNNQDRTFELGEAGKYIQSSGDRRDFLEFSIDAPLSVEECLKIAPAMKEAIKQRGRTRINYEFIAPEENEILASCGDDGLVIPIGMKTGGNIVKIELGQRGSSQVHSLIVGTSRSGKSNLLHTVITSALQRYPASDLHIYLLDFKEGVEFAVYGDYNIPNFKVIALESEQEFGVNVLREIELECRRRAILFDELGARELLTYNRAARGRNLPRLPRMLIIMDEFHVLFSGGNNEAIVEAKNLLSYLIPTSGAFGVHMIFSTQTMQRPEIAANFDEGIMTQILVRVALKCHETDAPVVLGDEADAIAQIAPNDPGAAIFRSNYNTPKNSVMFRTAYLDWENENTYFKGILEDLQSRYTIQEVESKMRVLVSDVGRSHGNIFQNFMESMAAQNTSRQGRIHLGESLRLDINSVEAVFERAANENLLLAGGNVDRAQSLLFFLTANLVLQKIGAQTRGEPTPRIYVFNLSDGDMHIRIAKDCLKTFCLKFIDKNLFDGYSYCSSSDFYEKLQEAGSGENSEGGGRVWAVISNLGYPNVFSQPGVYGLEDDQTRKNYNALRELLQNGSSKGIHVVAWHRDINTFKAQYDNWLDLFSKRIAFNMPGAEAKDFANVPENDPCINNDRANNAFFYQRSVGTTKFRPYRVPTDAWMDEFFRRLNAKLTSAPADRYNP